jgi:hypothetical protein
MPKFTCHSRDDELTIPVGPAERQYLKQMAVASELARLRSLFDELEDLGPKDQSEWTLEVFQSCSKIASMTKNDIATPLENP